jgi:hypothetical protein
MYSNGAICLIKLLFDLGLFTVWIQLNCTLLKINDFLRGNSYNAFKLHLAHRSLHNILTYKENLKI